LGDKAGGTWLYVGAGQDMRPLIISQPGSCHWWIDPVYDPGHIWYQSDKVGNIYKRFHGLGERPVVMPDEIIPKISTLTLKDQTKIVFAGGEHTREDLYPKVCDVVFLADITPNNPDELNILKKDGFVIKMEAGEGSSNLLGLASLEDVDGAFLFIESFPLEVRPGEKGTIKIFKKQRELTRSEQEQLSLSKTLEMFLDDPHGSFAVLESEKVSSGDWQNKVLQIIKRKIAKLGHLEPSTVEKIREAIAMKYDIDELRAIEDKWAKDIIDFLDSLR
jgi:hypothetical protein